MVVKLRRIECDALGLPRKRFGKERIVFQHSQPFFIGRNGTANCVQATGKVGTNLASNNRIYGLKGGFSNRSPEQEDVLTAVQLFPVPDVIGIVLFDGNDGAICIGPIIEKTDPVFAFGGAQSIFAISTKLTQQGFVTCIRGSVDCMGEIVKSLHRKQSSRMRL